MSGSYVLTAFSFYNLLMKTLISVVVPLFLLATHVRLMVNFFNLGRGSYFLAIFLVHNCLMTVFISVVVPLFCLANCARLSVSVLTSGSVPRFSLSSSFVIL